MRAVVWILAPCFCMSLGSEHSFLTWERGDVEGLLGSSALPSASRMSLGRAKEPGNQEDS